MSQNCCICSESFFQTIYDAAINLEKDFITEAIKLKRNSRLNFVKEKIPSFIFNFKFEEFEKILCEERIESMGIIILCGYYEENVLNIIALKDYILLNYYVKQELKKDILTVNFVIKEAEKERERRAVKFIKSYLKQNKQFKLQEERKGCDCLLLFNPAHTTNKTVYSNNETSEKQNKLLDIWEHKIYFLKNKNPRDSKQNARSYIKKATPAPKVL